MAEMAGVVPIEVHPWKPLFEKIRELLVGVVVKEGRLGHFVHIRSQPAATVIRLTEYIFETRGHLDTPFIFPPRHEVE